MNAFEQYEHYFNGELPEKEDVHKQIEIFDEAGRLSGKFTHIDDDDTKTNDESQTNDEDDEYNEDINKNK